MGNLLKKIMVYFGFVDEEEVYEEEMQVFVCVYCECDCECEEFVFVFVMLLCCFVVVCQLLVGVVNEIFIVYFKQYCDVQLIVESFCEGVLVIINFFQMSDVDVCCFIDFVSGFLFGLYGCIECVILKVFLFLLENIVVLGYGGIVYVDVEFVGFDYLQFVQLVVVFVSIVYLVLLLYIFVFFVCFILDYILMFNWEWCLKGFGLVVVEVVYMVIDLFIWFFWWFILLLCIGLLLFDFGFMFILLVVLILMNIVGFFVC